MRYAVVLVLAVVVSCVGCVHTSQGLRAPGAQPPGQYSQGPPVAGPPGAGRGPLHKPECVSVGLSLGGLTGVSSGAVEGFHDSKFTAGPLIGLQAEYIFPPPARMSGQPYGFNARFGTGLRVEDYSMLLTENGFKFGDLHISTTVFTFKYLHLPEEMRKVGFHFDLGLGWGSTSFSKDDELIADDILLGITTDISPGSAGIFALGAGLDFYVAPDMTLSLDLRFSSALVPVDWVEDGILISDIDWFDASTQQIIFGFNFFF